MADESQQSDDEVSSLSEVDSFDLEKREFDETKKKVSQDLSMGVVNLIAQKNTEIMIKKTIDQKINDSFHSSYTLSSCERKNNECKKKGAHHRNMHKSKTIVEHVDQA
jgi:hypothetical protein